MSTPDPELTTDGGPVSEDAVQSPDDQVEPQAATDLQRGDAAEPSPEESALAQPQYPTS